MKSITMAQWKALQRRSDVGTLSTEAADLAAHAQDESSHHPSPPDLVVRPTTTGEVASLLVFCHREGIPVTPWGSGTSLEANPMALQGGICLDLSGMNQIIELRPRDLQVTVQPGVLHTDLNARLARHGLFFPPDPGAPCSIGGMVANNAAGIRALKYGATKAYVLALEVVMADGQVMRHGRHSMRSSSGYDLVRLLVGSEGTLGIFTEITLRLAGIAPELAAATASFDSLEHASEAVVALVQAGLTPTALELMDATTVAYINAYEGLALPEEPLIFLEFSGNRAAVEEDVSFARELCSDHGCQAYQPALGREARDQLWKARHHVAYASEAANPGLLYIATDVAVPLSRVPQMVALSRRLIDEAGLSGAVFGHAGDGNLHTMTFYPATDEGQAQVASVNWAMVNQALEWGGTATGEHGVGAGKILFMEQEHGASYRLMREIKDLFDPQGILNPGKIFASRS